MLYYIIIFKACGNRRVKTLHNEQLQNVCCVLNIIKGNKIKWDEMGEVCNIHGKEYEHI